MRIKNILLLSILIFLVGGLFFLFLDENLSALSSPSTVGTSTVDIATYNPLQLKAFYGYGRFWVFYSNGTSIGFRSSTDGSTWSDYTVVVDQTYADERGDYLSIWFDGTYVYLYRGSSWQVNLIYYRRGTPSTGGTISWGSEVQVDSTGGNTAFPPFGTKGSDGYPWIAYSTYYSPYQCTGAVWHLNVRKATAVDGSTWGSRTTFCPRYYPRLVPLTGSKVYLIYSNPSSPYQLYGRLFDGSWGSEETISTTLQLSAAFSAVAEGDNVHLVFLDTSYNIKYIKRTYGVGWGTAVTVQSSTTSTSSPVLSIDTFTNNLYLFWAGSPTANHIYYKKNVGGTWDASPTDWITETTLTGNDRLTAYYKDYDDKIGLVYMTGTASPYNIRHDYLSLPRIITVSGNTYEDEGTTALVACDGVTNMIALRVGGTTYGPVACANADGSFSFSNVPTPPANTPMIIWLDGVTDNYGSNINRFSSGNVTGIAVRRNRVIVQHDDSGPITNTNLDTWDNDNDTDINYVVTDGVLTVEEGSKLIVNVGDTFAPGGNVTTPAMRIAGIYSAGSFTLTLTSGGTSTTCTDSVDTVIPLCIDSGGVFLTGTSTVRYAASSATNITAAAVAGNWLTSWNYRKSHVINSATGTGTNYQVKVVVWSGAGTDSGENVYLNNRALNWPNDIRFTDDDATTLLDHWLESYDATKATFWVEVKDDLSSVNQIIYIYYGRSGESSASNGDNTFNFFDDFPGTSINTSKWTIVNSTGFSVSGGELRGTNTTGRLRSISTFSAPIVQEVKVRTLTLATNGQTTGGFWVSTSNGFTLLQYPTTDYVRNDGAWTSLGGNVIPEDNVPLLLRFSAFSTSVNFTSIRLDTNVTTYNNTFTNTVSAETIMIGKRADDSYTGQTYNTYWDWIRIRKYTSPEPSHGAWGNIESPPLIYNNLELLPSANGITFTLGTDTGQIIKTEGNLTIGNGTNTGIINANTNDPTLDVDGNFTNSSNATFTASDISSFTVAGNWSNSGTFNHSNGTVTFEAGGVGFISGWDYRKSHVINSAAGAGTNYQVRIRTYYGSGTSSGENVYLNGKSRTDFGDVRFTDDDGTTLLDYWMEEKVDGNYAIYWVEVQDDLSSTSQTIYLYYGKSDTATTSSQLNTKVWQLKEHDYAAPTYLPDIIFTKPTASELQLDSAYVGEGPIGNGYSFIEVDRNWLNGKYLRWSWRGRTVWTLDRPYSSSMSIYDGTLDRKSNTDFPTGGGVPNTQLQAVSCVGTPENWGPETKEILVDVSAGVKEKVTIAVIVGDAWAGQDILTIIDWLEINTGPNGVGNLFREDFVDEPRMEITGTYKDYGLFRKYVSPEPSHGSWGSEEMPPSSTTFSGSTTFYNLTSISPFKELIFTIGTTQSVEGTLTLNGQDCFTMISLRSTSPGFQWNLNLTGTSDINYVDVKDNNATGNTIVANNSFDSGNNTNWTIDLGTCGITVSGNAYEDEGTTPLIACDGTTNMISLRVGDTTHGPVPCADADGAFTISDVPLPLLSAGEPLVIWIDNQAGIYGSNINRYAGSGNVTGIALRKERVIVQHDDSGPITNTNLDTWDNDNDTDINYVVTDGVLTVEEGSKLIVNTNDTFAPGGNVILSGSGLNPSGDLLVMSGATLNGTYNVIVRGGDVTGNGQINLTGGTFLLDGSGSFGGNTAWTFYNLTFGDGVGAAVTVATGTGGITVSNLLTISPSQTLIAGPKIWTLAGSGTPFLINGTFAPSISTFRYTGSSTTNITATTYRNLTFSPTITASITYTGAGVITVSNNLDINPNATSPYSLTFNLGGNTSVTGSTTIRRTGSATSILNTTASNYSLSVGSLSIQAGSTLTANGSTLDSNGNVTIGSGGTLNSTSGNFNVGGNWSNSGTFTHSSGTVTFDGTSQQTFSGSMTGSSSFYNLTITNNSGTDPDTDPSIIFLNSATATTANFITPSTKIRFNAGSTYTFTNINFNGQGAGTRITFRSSIPGSQWNLVVTGTQSVSYTNPKDSNACGGDYIDAANGTNLDGGNNNCWIFIPPTVSGNAYEDETSTPLAVCDGTTNMIALRVGDATYGPVPCNDSDGAFTISNIYPLPSTGAPMVIWIDNQSGIYGSNINRFPGFDPSGYGDVTDIALRRNRVIVQHDDSGPISNTDLDTWDNDNDTDINYVVSYSGPDFLSGWSYRKSHIINPAAGAGTNYPIKIVVWKGTGTDSGENVYLNNLALNWPNDIRFTDDDGTTLLNHWLESSDATKATFWVEVQDDLSTTDQTIYIYYGKSDATTTSNIENTFLFGDDIELGNLSRWTTSANWSTQTTTVKSGTYAAKADVVDNVLKKTHTLYQTKVVEVWMRSPVTNDYFYVYEKYDATPKSANLYFRDNGYFAYYTTAFTDITTYSANTWYRIKLVLKSSTQYDIYIYNTDGTLKGSATNISYRSYDPDGLTFFPDNALGFVDNAFIRKFVSPEPSHGDWGIGVYDLTVEAGSKLIVNTNDTFTPGGNVTLSGTGPNPSGDLLVMSGATFDGTYDVTVRGGDATGDGEIYLTDGTFLLDGNGNFGGDTNWTFYDLTFGDGTGAATTTAIGTGGITISNLLTIASSQTLIAGPKTWTLSSSGTPFILNGTLAPSISTFQYTAEQDTIITAANYYNLELIDPPKEQSENKSPRIIDAYVEPTKVFPGNTMLVTAEIEDNYGIQSVIADMGGIETIELNLASGNIYQGIWKNQWLVHDTESKKYITKIIATNILGNSDEIEVEWEDPYVWQSCESGYGPYGPYYWYYFMGYRFRPNQTGIVTKLCAFVYGTTTVKLQDSAYNVLASASVTAYGYWSCTSITPVNVTAGNYYYVGVWLAGSAGGYYRDSPGLPKTCNNVYIASACYEYGVSQFSYPYCQTYTMYGMADIEIVYGPTVSTLAATDITSSQATLNGNVTGLGGGGNIDERGFDWGTSPGSYPDSWTETGSFGTGTFSHPITGLESKTTYYFRAKAHNSLGWGYGSEMSFTTSVLYTLGPGTFNIQGYLLIGNGTDKLEVTADTYDPSLDVDGDFTILANATFTASDTAAFSIGGDFSNSGIFNHSSGNVTFDGTSQQTLAGSMTGSSAFYSLTITNSSGTDLDIDPSIIFNDSADATTATFTTPSTKIRFNAGSTYTFTNINFNGQGAGTRITFRSSIPGSQWDLVVTGTQSVSYASPKDSNACGGDNIEAYDGTNLDGGNNDCWAFGIINVSGMICSSEPCTGSNPSAACDGTTSNVALSVNGGAPATTTCSAADGSYSFSNVNAIPNDVITLFVDENATDASFVYSTEGLNISDLDFYDNIVVVRHDDTTGPVTIADMANYDSDQEPNDIRFDAETSPAALDIEANTELHIWTEDTFEPGGTVTTGSGSDIHIDDNATFIAGGTISCGGSWIADTGATFIHNNNDVIFTSTSIGETITTNYQNFYNLIFNGSGGEWTIRDAVTLDNDLTVTAGTLLGDQEVTVNGGDVTGDGDINLTGGTFTLDGNGNFGGNTNWDFYHLTFGDGGGTDTTTATGTGLITVAGEFFIDSEQTLIGSKDITVNGGYATGDGQVNLTGGGTFVLEGDGDFGGETGWTFYDLTIGGDANIETTTAAGRGGITILNVLTIGANQELDAGSKTWTLAGSGTPSLINGTFTANSSTVNYVGTAATNLTATTYYNLGVGTTANAIAVVYTLGGDTTVDNILTVGNDTSTTFDTLNASSYTLTLSNSGTPFYITSRGTFSAGNSTVEYIATAPTTLASTTYYNLSVGTIADDTAVTYILGGNTTVSNVLTVGNDTSTATDTFNASSYILTFSGSGTPFVLTSFGTFSAGTSTVRYTASAPTNVTATTYNNLELSPSDGITFDLGTDTGQTIEINSYLTIGNGINIGIVTAATNNPVLDINGDFTISANATFIASGTSSFTVAGNWSNSGTFAHSNGTVTFDIAGWLSGWGYRKSHIVNAATGAGTNYQVRIRVNYGSGTDSGENVYLNGKSRTDFGDVRFTDDDGATLLDYWMESKVDSDYAIFWVEVTDDLSPQNQTIYIYYGKGDATTTSSGDTTFIFFDDFSGSSLDTSKWEVYELPGGSHFYEVTGGELHVYALSNAGVGSGYYFTTISTFDLQNFALYTKGRWANVDYDRGGGFFQSAELLDGDDQRTGILLELMGSYWLSAYKWRDGSRVEADYDVSPDYTSGNSEVSYKVIGTSFDNDLTGTYTKSDNPTITTFTRPFKIRLWSSVGEWTDDVSVDSYHDLVFLRKYISPEPSHGDWGSEEEPIGGETTFSGSTTFYNLTSTTPSKELVFTIGTTQSVEGTLTLNGQDCQTMISLRSTVSGTQWNINVSGTSDVSYVDVKDSNATGNTIIANNSFNFGNNTNWTMDMGVCGISLSGNAYENEGTTSLIACDGTTNMVALRVGGLTYGPIPCADSDGSFTFSDVLIALTSDPIIIWIDGVALNYGSNINRYAGSGNVTGIALRKERVIVQHDDPGPISNTDLDTWDNDNDTDINYVVDVSNNLTVEEGSKLIINPLDTFTPGGNITTAVASDASGLNPSGDILIGSSATLNMESNTLSVGGGFVNSGTFLKTSPQTTIFTATGTGFPIIPGTGNFDNVIFNGVGGGWSFTTAVILDGNLTMAAGTLSGVNNITVNGGNVTGNGKINLTGGTFILDGAGNFGGATSWTFYKLTVGGDTNVETTTTTGIGSITVKKTLTIGANQTLDAGSKTWTLSGSGTPFSISGTFNSQTSTFRYTGSSATNITATTYYNLTLSPTITASITYTGAGVITVSNNLDINPNATSPYSLTFNLGGNTSVTGSTTIRRTGSATSTLNTTTNNYSLTVGSFLVQAGATLNANGSTLDSAGNVTIESGGTLNSTSGNFNVGGNWSNSGTFTHSSGTVTFTAAGFLGGWGYRKSHVINAASGAGTNYQVRITVHYGSGTDSGEDVYLNGKSRADFGDIRFTDNDETTLLDYWTEDKVDGDYAIFWVEVQDDLSTENQTIYIYYGNSTASYTGDAEDVFGYDIDTTYTYLKYLSPIFYWEDRISNTDLANGDDVCSTTQDLQFDAHFYGLSATSYVVSSNGILDMEGICRVWDEFYTSKVISFHNDLRTDTAGGIVTTPGVYRDSFIDKERITYEVTQYGDSSTSVKFQFILFPSGNIIYSVDNATNIDNFLGWGEKGISKGDSTDYFEINSEIATNKTWIFYLRKFVSPEPSHGDWGSEERPTIGGGSIVAGVSPFYNINFDGGTWSFFGSTTVKNDFAIISGSVTAPSGDLKVGGDWSNSGTFRHNFGKVILNGTSQQTLSGWMKGSSSFYNLAITNNSGTNPESDPSIIFTSSATANTANFVTPSTKIHFNAGSTYTLTNINFNGQGAGTRITLYSSTPGIQWNLVVTGTQSVSYTNPQDSNACNGDTINARNGTNLNGGNNTCWDFAPTITSVSDSPDPQQSGSDITFDSVASDIGDTIKLYVCKNSACTKCGPEDTSNCWAVTTTAVGTNPSAAFTCLSCTGTNNYWAKVCDSSDTCSLIISGGSFSCLKENSCAETVGSNCLSGYVADGYCCNTACTGTCQRCDATPGTCTIRLADDNTECPACQRCDGVNTSCQAVTADDGKDCEDDCTRCVSGSCIDRSQCDGAECTGQAKCDTAGGDCKEPDVSDSVCSACYNSSWDPIAKKCCGDDKENEDSWCSAGGGSCLSGGTWHSNHCQDNTKNCDEEWTDCGGIDCDLCPLFIIEKAPGIIQSFTLGELLAGKVELIKLLVGKSTIIKYQASRDLESVFITYSGTIYEFEKEDRLFTLRWQNPPRKGRYDLSITFVYPDGEEETYKIPFLIDPLGYIYQVTERGQQERIKGAKVLLYQFDEESKDWKIWEAKNYGQENPQITDITGEYSFIVLSGKYYIEASKEGYRTEKTEEFKITDEPINKNIELKLLSPFWKRFWWVLGISIIAVGAIIIIYSWRKQREETRGE